MTETTMGRRTAASYRLGFDIGGTFTDLALVPETGGEVRYTKVPSTPQQPELAVFDGVEAILKAAGVTPAQVSYLVHGSTVAANAVLESRGARTGLLTTAGFRDILEIGRLARGARDESAEMVLYNVAYVKPPPLVPRHLRVEVPERIGPDGAILQPLDEAAAIRVIERLKAEAVESVAICLLHSYANPRHERRLRELVRERMPGVWTALSCEVLPQYREYERLSTTSLNAYLMPPLNRYLARLETGLRARGFKAPLHVMQANGGVMTARLARLKSVHTAFSGLVGGVLGGALVAALGGHRNAVTLDIGGTSTDIALVRDGEPDITTEGRLGSHPVHFPIVAVRTIGAGGGSLAWAGQDGFLKVGPQSAGADPGPACYGRDGTDPTVTDAHVCLGRINPSHLLAGALGLHAEAAREALAGKLAGPLGLRLEEAAEGVLAVAEAQIVRAIRAATIERGVDPRDCVLVAYGGAGPLHAVGVAEAIGIRTVLIPRFAGVISALGLLASGLKQEYGRTWVRAVADVDHLELDAAFRELEDQAAREMAGEGIKASKVRLSRSLGLRYVGQGYEIPTPLAGRHVTGRSVAATVKAFHERHRALYRHAAPDEPVEIISLLITATARVTPPSLRSERITARAGRPAIRDERWVVFGRDGGSRRCAVYDRAELRPGHRVAGPAIVEQFDTTTVIPPGYAARVDPFDTLIIERRRGAARA